MGSDARERLVAAAADLMHQRGYEAVGVADLCEAAGVKRGSFYHFFESKQALALVMLDESWQRTRVALFAPAFEDETIGAIEAVQRYGELLAAHQRRLLDERGAVPGCRVGNLAIELATLDETIRLAVRAILDEMIDIVASSIERGAADDENPPIERRRGDARRLATVIIAQMEGLMVLAKAHRDPELLVGLGDLARALLPSPSTPSAGA